MKKALLLVSLMVILTSPIFPQQKTLTEPQRSRVFLLADGGYSLPLGKYASDDKKDSEAGFAAGGFYIQAGAYWLGKHDFGLGISYAFQYNSVQGTADSVPLNASGYYLGDKPWSNNYLLAGPVFMKSIGKINILAGINAGFIISSWSGFNIALPKFDSLSEPQLSEGLGTGFAFQVKASIGYQVTSRIGIRLDLSYLGGSPSRTKTYYYYYYVVDPVLGIVPVYQGSEFTVKKKVNTFNAGLGITIKI
jgi:hypothetical protein